jgi:hypothetical protein
MTLINLNTNILFRLQNEQPWHLPSLGPGEGRRSVLLHSYAPSAGLRILIFSLLLNYTGCQSTVGDILSSEIYTNTQSTLRRLCTISFTPTQHVNHRLFRALNYSFSGDRLQRHHSPVGGIWWHFLDALLTPV